MVLISGLIATVLVILYVVRKKTRGAWFTVLLVGLLGAFAGLLVGYVIGSATWDRGILGLVLPATGAVLFLSVYALIAKRRAGPVMDYPGAAETEVSEEAREGAARNTPSVDPSQTSASSETSSSETSLRRDVNIFLCYRRNDSADITGRIYDRLAAHYGKERVFKDVDSIPFGVDFRAHLDEMVAGCDALIAVIGRKWLDSKGPDSERPIDDPSDFVRIEIEAALSRNVPVIPTLVQGAKIPSEESLPLPLKALVYRHGISVRPDPDFHADMNRLINSLDRHLGKKRNA